jgi:hypothetical protein
MEKLWTRLVSLVSLCACVVLVIFLSGILTFGIGPTARGLVSEVFPTASRAMRYLLSLIFTELLRGGTVAIFVGWLLHRPILRLASRGFTIRNTGAFAGKSTDDVSDHISSASPKPTNIPAAEELCSNLGKSAGKGSAAEAEHLLEKYLTPFVEAQTHELTQMRVQQENQRERMDFMARQLRSLTDSVNKHWENGQADSGIIREALVNIAEFLQSRDNAEPSQEEGNELGSAADWAEEPVDFWTETEPVYLSNQKTKTQDKGVQCDLTWQISTSTQTVFPDNKEAPCHIATIKTTNTKMLKPVRTKSPKRVNIDKTPISAELLKELASKPLTEAAELVNKTLKEERQRKRNKPLTDEEKCFDRKCWSVVKYNKSCRH